MNENEFIIDLLGKLDQKKTQKQVNADIKQIEKTINMLRFTATLAQGSSKKEINAYIKSLQSQLDYVKLTAKIDSKNLKSEVDKALNNVSFKDIDVLNIDENETKLKVQKVIADAKEYVERNPISVGINYESRRGKLDNDLTTYLNKNTKINESSVLLKEADQVRDLIGAVNDKKSLNEATDAFQLFKSSVSSLGYNTKSTADKVKGMISHVTKIGSVLGLASLATNNFVQALKTLRSNDTILTEISKTSELNKKQLQELGDEAFKIAGKYGQLSSSFLLATQEMARAGYGKNLKDMAELSTKVQGAGDMAAELSNQYIIATDKAFKMNGSIEALAATLDGANNITNNNALSMTDLAEAMSIVGSQAASSGMEVDETTAAVATMIAVTQRSGSEIANAFKGILMNLQQVTGEVDGEEIDAESLTKYEKACNELGVSLSTVKDGVVSLKEPMEIIRELSEAYTQLDKSDARRANLLSAVGGKSRANALNALLENYDMYSTMLEQYADGLGSMDKEAEKTAKSWEGRMNSLSNSFTSFVNTLTNKEAVLNGVSFFDRLIQGAESLVDTFGTIPVALTAVNTSLVAMNKDYGITKIWDSENRKIDIEGNIFGIDISQIKNLKKHYEEAEEAIEKWNSRLADGKTNIENFDESVVQNNTQLKEYLSTCSKEAPASLEGYRKYLKDTGQATEELRLKTILLNSALTFFGSIAVQTVITGIATAYDNWIHRVEKANDAMDEAVSEYDSAKSSLESINSELAEHNNKVNELLSKDKLTYAEKGELEELQAITKELMLQQDIERRRVDKASKEVAEKTVDAYEAQYGKYGRTREDLKDKLSDERFPMPESEDDILGNIAAYVRAKELLEKSQREYQDVMHVGGDTSWIEDGILRNTDAIEDISQVLGGNISDLQEKRLALEAEYNKAVEKRQTGIGVLTSYEQDVISTYESIYDMIKMVYEYTDQNEWNSMEITDILNTKGIEKTKDELIAMSKAGELTPETLAGFGNLNRAVQNSELILQDGQTAAEAFCNEIQAYAEAGKDMAESLSGTASITPTISSSVQQLSGQLEPQFAKLGEAYQAIFADDDFSLDAVDNSMLEGLRRSFAEIEDEVGVTFDPSALEPFFDTLTNKSSGLEDVHKAFDNLATAYFYSTDTLEQLNDETADAIEKQLEEMGVQNAAEVVAEALAAKTEELAVAKEFLAERGYELSAASVDDANAFILEQIEAGNCSEALALLQLKKMLINGTLLDTNTDINNVLTLAKAAGVAVDSLGILISLKAEFDSAMASGNYGAAAVLNGQIAIYKTLIENEIANFNPVGVDFGKIGGGASEARSAGKDAGKSYKDGLKEELSDLDSVISGITGRIDDQISVIKTQKEAALESIDAQIDALNEQKSLLEDQKKALEEARDAAVEALEDERDARIEVLEVQKEQLEEQIKLIEEQIKDKEKAIDSIQDEIDAMKDANEQRKRQIDLQKAMYELERLQHQRTILQYSEDKGMHYVSDTKGIRDQKQAVDDTKLEIEIANKEKQIGMIEKEISLLEDKKDAISEQITLLDEEIDKIKEFYDAEIEKTKEFYDSQIKAIDSQIESIDKQIESIQRQREQTEQYYESLIENLEKSKSKYQELTEILEQAELSAKIMQLGIDEEALLNGSEEEFEKLKNAYLDVVFKLNEGNAEVLSKLQELSGYDGTAPAVLTDSNTKLDEMNGKLDESSQGVGNVNTFLGETASSIGEVVSNVSSITENLSEANSLVTEEQSAFGSLKQKIDEIIAVINEKTSAIEAVQNTVSNAVISETADFELLKEKILEIKECIGSINDAVATLEATPVNNLATAFKRLYEQLLPVSEILGVGIQGQEEGAVSGIASAIQALNEISLEDGIILQLDNLKTAIIDVASAISGGSSSGSGKGGDASASSSPSMGSGANGESSKGGGGGNSITDAITEMGETANEVIGEPDAEGDGTVIGEFGSMKAAVNDVTSAIGGGEESEENGGEGESGNNLIDSITSMGETTLETLGESGGAGAIGKFEEFEGVIEEADAHVTGISDGLGDIDGKEVECTIKVNIELNGGLPAGIAGATGTALDTMGLNSAQYDAKYIGNARVEGTALASGNWAVQSNEDNALVGELGYEIIVRNGRFFTVGNNGPEMFPIKKGDIVFNHEQSVGLLKKGYTSGRGKAYADGTLKTASDLIDRIPPGHQYPEMGLWERMERCAAAMGRTMDEMLLPLNAIALNIRKETGIGRLLESSNNVNNVTNNNKDIQQPVTVHQTVTVNCPNVTNNSGIEYVQRELGHLSLKAMQVPLKDY